MCVRRDPLVRVEFTTDTLIRARSWWESVYIEEKMNMMDTYAATWGYDEWIVRMFLLNSQTR